MSDAVDEAAPERRSDANGGPVRILGRFGLWLSVVAGVTMLAGVLFGYDQGVISGALHGIRADFDLSDTLVEVVTSWVTLGALVGALLAGGLADRLGRKTTLLVAGTLFSVGAAVQALAPDVVVLVAGRFVVGLGVGVASVAAPLYASELAPAKTRGRFVSAYQLAITIGILLAYIVDAALASGDHWRTMLGIAAIPGLLLLAVTLITPRSPRWLMKMGRRDEARSSLVKVSGVGDADTRLDVIQEELTQAEKEAAKMSWSAIFAGAHRKALWVGVGLALFQQITGINAIIYYANQIFDLAGFSSPTSQADATMVCVGGVNVLATFIAVAFVDKVGRRPLLFAGLTGMTISLLCVGGAFLFVDPDHTQRGVTVLGIVTMLSLVVYIASFAFSLGPIVWTIINEIYPNRIRGRAVALATAVNWGSAFLVSQFFLTMVNDISTEGTFFVFAGCSVLAAVWIWKKVPETKGVPLEEMGEIWQDPDPVRRSHEIQARQVGG